MKEESCVLRGTLLCVCALFSFLVVVTCFCVHIFCMLYKIKERERVCEYVVGK